MKVVAKMMASTMLDSTKACPTSPPHATKTLWLRAYAVLACSMKIVFWKQFEFPTHMKWCSDRADRHHWRVGKNAKTAASQNTVF